MNTLMYEHPLTSEHLRIVQDVVRYEVVGPIGKGLACGDVGTWEIHGGLYSDVDTCSAMQALVL
jgi:phosphopantothenoylcysteine synthetase/decarboxylase